MKFQVRRFIDSVPWAESGIVFVLLLDIVVLLYYATEHGKSKKPRCPACNQIIWRAK